MDQWQWIQLGSMRTWVWSLASLSEFRIRCCQELWCRSKMRLSSDVVMAMVQACSCSSNSTPSLGTSICRGCSPKKTKKKKKMWYWCKEKQIDWQPRIKGLETNIEIHGWAGASWQRSKMWRSPSPTNTSKKPSKSSCHGSVKTNLISIHEDIGLIPGPA